MPNTISGASRPANLPSQVRPTRGNRILLKKYLAHGEAEMQRLATQAPACLHYLERSRSNRQSLAAATQRERHQLDGLRAQMGRLRFGTSSEVRRCKKRLAALQKEQRAQQGFSDELATKLMNLAGRVGYLEAMVGQLRAAAELGTHLRRQADDQLQQMASLATQVQQAALTQPPELQDELARRLAREVPAPPQSAVPFDKLGEARDRLDPNAPAPKQLFFQNPAGDLTVGLRSSRKKKDPST